MKEALADVLPPEILDRKKRGFGTPMGAWLKARTGPGADARCSAPRRSRARGLLRPDGRCAALIADHRANRSRRHRPAAGAAQPRDLVRASTSTGASRAGRGRRAARHRRWSGGMKILYVCHRFPFPPKRGGKIRPFNMIRHLHGQGHRGHGVLAGALARRRRREARGHRAVLRRSSRSRRCASRCSGLRMVARLPHADTVVDGLLLQRRSRPQRCAGCLAQQPLRPDLRALLVGGAVCAARARRAEDPRLRRHGFAEVARVRAATSRSRCRWATGSRAARCSREEKRLARRFDLCTATTRAEWETLEGYGTGAATDWFPNGVDSEYFAADRRAATTPTRSSFVGRMDYYPNQECMLRLLHRTRGRCSSSSGPR